MAQIIFDISDAKVPAFKAGFLKEWPTPEGMTDNQWIKQWGKEQYLNAYKRGLKTLAIEATEVDEGIVT